ncbi:MAG: NADH-quinone oxidoreductase subunit F [Dehalococcoidia bacterium]|nr:NADH-quinone oxidoreductase subunit F [Dehalococcoidia bacterium]
MRADFKELKMKADSLWDRLIGGQGHWIRIGSDLSGQSAGSEGVASRFEQEIGQRNLKAIVTEVGTLGLCFAEPLVDIVSPNMPRTVYGNVKPEDVPSIIDSHLIKGVLLKEMVVGVFGQNENNDLPDIFQHPMMKDQLRIALRNAGHVEPGNVNHYLANDGYAALHKVLKTMTPEEVCEEILESGLRGRGGAAFPTGTKWKFLAGAKSSPKYVLVNCEEGDPGAFNDKTILDSDPHSLLEGLIICGYATGATKGYIFIRHGHDSPINRSWRAIDEAYEVGILGTDIFGSGFDFDVEVSLTGDSYVAGEETALMESIEGKRALPRYRPPFPAQFGLFGKPTNINNVKTLSYVPQIMLNGGKWFSDIGYGKSKGTAILCLSGHLKYTGLVEVPFGLTLRHLIDDIGGGSSTGNPIKLLQTGGPLGGVISSDRLDVILDFEAMSEAGAILGSGGIVAADSDISVVDLTRSIIAFCQYESCGKCFPCRSGMSHLLEILERICVGEGSSQDIELMRSVGTNMQAGSLCGHGQLGFNPVSSALQYFGAEFEDMISDPNRDNGRNATWYSPLRTRR